MVKSKVYGETNISKHVLKRMDKSGQIYIRLKPLKQKKEKEKLSDGKLFGKKGRLTDANILQIQKYYGKEI